MHPDAMAKQAWDVAILLLMLYSSFQVANTKEEHSGPEKVQIMIMSHSIAPALGLARQKRFQIFLFEKF